MLLEGRLSGRGLNNPVIMAAGPFIQAQKPFHFTPNAQTVGHEPLTEIVHSQVQTTQLQQLFHEIKGQVKRNQMKQFILPLFSKPTRSCAGRTNVGSYEKSVVSRRFSTKTANRQSTPAATGRRNHHKQMSEIKQKA